ncbi:MAG: 2-hydroxyglutaryl-CoA dehydratase [Ruminococcaceae bacterium]|nr:2-hydroxyglutaryl-CoA dehydratase [Oscillospiraceae bacterium]
MEKNYVVFTEQMKKDYTILIPNMLPMHFTLIAKVLNNYGFNTEILMTEGQEIKDTGLKYCHNDTCYPAILVIGQFIEALQSGRYDTDKVALIMFQTGGGCRASNYINLIRKAVAKAGFAHVPVISFSLSGIEHHPGFKLSVGMLHRMMYAVLYGDLLMLLKNQCEPYEIKKGESAKKAEEWTDRLANEMTSGRISYRKVKENYRKIIRDFYDIPREAVKKTRVGVVGEIFVKYAPFANNNLVDFLVSEGAEVTVPGLLDFCLYCVYNSIVDRKLYGYNKRSYGVYKLAFSFLVKKQADMIRIIEENSDFDPPTPFEHTISLVDGYIGLGTKMGEGWLLTAEMLELADKGVPNIVCAQPFGCLPNHICGKGIMKPLKERNPDINIVAIDYDAGATAVNQENRIKLMLANSKDEETRVAF